MVVITRVAKPDQKLDPYTDPDFLFLHIFLKMENVTCEKACIRVQIGTNFRIAIQICCIWMTALVRWFLIPMYPRFVLSKIFAIRYC